MAAEDEDEEEEDDPWEDEDDSEDDDKEDDPWAEEEEEEQESPKDRRSRGDNDPEATRPAQSSRAPTDRTQDFKPTRKPLVLLSPRIGPAPFLPQMGHPGALNDELVVGLTVGLWPTRRLGLEVNLSGFPLGGADNTKQLALAILRLLDRSFRLESVDREVSLTASLAALLLSGPVSIFGAPEIHSEVVLSIGAGFEHSSIEMLSLGTDDGGTESAILAQTQAWPHPIVSLSLGSRIFLHPKVGLRIDFRLQGGPVNVLNYDDGPEANSRLDDLANRLTCLDSSVPASDRSCKTTLEFSAGAELALEFAVVGSKAEARRHGK